MLFRSTDKRRVVEKPEIISNYLNNNSSCTYSKQELFQILSSELGVKERQYGYYLNELEKNKKIYSPSIGYYSSINYMNFINEDANGDI